LYVAKNIQEEIIMKKLIAIIMVIAMIAGLAPAVFAVPGETSSKPETLDKTEVFGENDLQPHEMYGYDYYGNKSATGHNPTKSGDLSEVSKKYHTLNQSQVKGWADSTNYGVPFMDQAQSLVEGYQCENVDFKPNTDFLTSGKKSFGMFFTPADTLQEIVDDRDTHIITKFNQGDKFWFNFSLISGYGTSPNFYKNDFIMSVYMYSGTLEEFQNQSGGLPLKASWTAMNRVSVNITVPKSGLMYMFFVVVKDEDMQSANGRGFGGWLTISDHEKNISDLAVKQTIDPYKDYTLDLDRDAEMTLLYGSDEAAGYVLAPAALYAVQLKGGQKYAIVPEGDGTNGVRIMMLDENRDILFNNYLGTGTAADIGYASITCPVLPVVDGTYYFIVAGFMYTDGGTIDFSIKDFHDVQNENLDTLPDFEDEIIDLESLGTENVDTVFIAGEPAWNYVYSSDVNMGIVTIVLPGTYNITGENRNLIIDIYDGVTIDMQNATSGTILTSGTWAPERVNATGKCKVEDGFWGAAIMNDEGFTGVYITGDEIEFIGELSCGGLMECATHILCKRFVAQATLAAGTYPVAFWATGFMGQHLTFPSDAKLVNASGQNLNKASLFFDQDSYYLNGYTVSQYSDLHRFGGSPDYYSIADYFEFGSSGYTPGPTTGPTTDPTDQPSDYLLGDANLDNSVNTGDATAVLKHAAGMAEITIAKALIQADVNQDGTVNTGDATFILKIAAGMLERPVFDPTLPHPVNP
jgi:hypothetical protein